MKLTLNGIKERTAWETAGITLPSYDVDAVVERTRKAPVWVHFGIGNIFRIFLGGIADRLLEEGVMDRGITCAEAFDFDVVDKIYEPYDNLALSVILHGDGRVDKKVLGSLAEAVKAIFSDEKQWNRLKEIFRDPGLQMVSFTITEKGYALTGTDGSYMGFIKTDIENGPEKATSAMAVVTAMLLERFRAGAAPLTLVSMDNCAKNGDRLRTSVLQMAQEWEERGFVDEAFLAYVSDKNKVSFPWTMIDKITPRPSEQIADELEAAGLEAMQPVITDKKTFIAPFVNGEEPQYLVMEDSFPNGRPMLEKAGVYMTDQETVNKAERMKVTVCLNPIHSALGPYGCVLGYTLFSDEMNDPDMLKLAHLVGAEGMEVVPDPGILSPQAFLDECIYERFPNPYLGDTVQRLTTDISQGVGVRFGETVKAYVEKDGTAESLTGIALAIAGWVRYLLAVDDMGNAFELSPDPLNEELQELLAEVKVGDPSSLNDHARGILSNKNIFGVDLYEAGLGEKIEAILREQIAGIGAVRKTVQKYLGTMQNYTLQNGVQIPMIGYGTYKATDEREEQTIMDAIAAGYRHLDTASFYMNEEKIGEAIQKSGIDRKELFLTTKVWRMDLGYEFTMESFEKSCQKLQTDYLDMLLIHWPTGDPVEDWKDQSWRQKTKDTWRAMEQLYAEGKVRAIGVSNFLPHHLMNLMEDAKVMPMVNQLEYHPGYTQQAAVDFCRRHNILVEAWSPLGRRRVMEEPLLLELAEKYQRSVAQICLRFELQEGILPLPKASSMERMKQNMDVFDFELSEEDMFRLLTLPQVGWSGEHPDRARVMLNK